MTKPLRRLSIVVAVSGAVLAPASASLAQAPAQVPSPDHRAVAPAAPNPLVGEHFFVDHKLPAYRQYRYYRRSHHKGLAGRISYLAHQPQFRWFGRWNHPPRRAVKKFIARARHAGQVPLVTVLRHQGKKCHSGYTGGGAREDARTRKWYRNFARGVGNSRAVIAFEPDSLGTLDCLVKSRRKARLKMLRYGVDVLSKLPNATVYLEGGASDWESEARTAKLLRYIGISKVRGFMVNVTHYDWTANNVSYGLKVSRLTGGKHFVISTAFNGRGPVHFTGAGGRRMNVWCHPLRRGLGPAPGTATMRPDKVDAYLYIGRPGFSGGSCNGGPLPIGSWWAKRAVMFSNYATNWVRPAAGTKNGWGKRYSLRALGAPR